MNQSLLYQVLAGFVCLVFLIQSALADVKGEDLNHPILSVPFQRIEAGSFMLSSFESENHRDDEEDRVQIIKPFEIMTTEVTQSLWVKVMGANPSRFQSKQYCDDYEEGMCPNNPVEQVSWHNVKEFIEKLNSTLGLNDCNGAPDSVSGCYRLPTEAEWEYATRAGTNTTYSFGDDYDFLKLGEYAWYYDNSDNQTHEVGLKEPNPWELYDVHGNVWEWVEDKWDTLLEDEDSGQTSNSYRVVRGGGWGNGGRGLRSVHRLYGHPADRFGDVGFRLVRTL